MRAENTQLNVSIVRRIWNETERKSEVLSLLLLEESNIAV